MRGVCAGLPDKRRERNVHNAMADIGMATFSVFFMQSPSFLAQQRRLLEGCGRSNCQTLFEMAEIPSERLLARPPRHPHLRATPAKAVVVKMPK